MKYLCSAVNKASISHGYPRRWLRMGFGLAGALRGSCSSSTGHIFWGSLRPDPPYFMSHTCHLSRNRAQLCLIIIKGL